MYYLELCIQFGKHTLSDIALIFSGLLYIKGINQDLNPNKLLGPTQPTPNLSKETKAEVDSLSADLHNNIAGH